jgi:hypothetical protein
MSRQKEVTAAVAECVRKAVPEINWSINIVGTNASREVEGTISCDEITYEQDTYDICTATAVYSVYVLDINGRTDVDNLSDVLFEALHNNDLNGVIDNGLVKRIVFGTTSMNTRAVAMLLEYHVEYYMEG